MHSWGTSFAQVKNRLRSSSRNRDHSGLVNSLVTRSLPLISLPPLDKGLVREGCGRRRDRLQGMSQDGRDRPAAGPTVPPQTIEHTYHQHSPFARRFKQIRDRDNRGVPLRFVADPFVFVMLSEAKHLGIAGKAPAVSSPRTGPRPDPSPPLTLHPIAKKVSCPRNSCGYAELQLVT